MVFFSILAIRPRVAGVHIPSLNHGRKPHSTPFQTDSKVTPSARPPTKQGGRRRTDTLNKRSCVGERRQIRQGRRLSPLLTVIVWRVTSGERLDEPWIDYQRKAVVEAPHRAMGSFGVPAPDASMPRVEQRASLWAQYVLTSFYSSRPCSAGQGPTLTAIRSASSVSSTFLRLSRSDRIFVWHLICGILIGVIVALHVAGALYPWLVKGDRVLQRVLPGNRV